MDLVQNLLIKIKKMSMDLVNDRESMDPVQRGGPWTPGPCFVLTRIQDGGFCNFVSKVLIGELKRGPKYVEKETSARPTVLFLWRKAIIR